MYVCIHVVHSPHPPNPDPPPPSPPPRQRHLARLRLPGPKGQRSLSATTFNAGLEPDVQVRLFFLLPHASWADNYGESQGTHY